MKRIIFGILLVVITMHVDAQHTPYSSKLNEQYTSGLFKSMDGYLINAEGDYAVNGYRDVFQYLIGKVPGLTIVPGRYGIPFVRYRNGYPAFYLDEMRVEASTIASINMNDVALIKVFRPPFVGAAGGGANGAIAIYTKDGAGDDAEETDD